jgi:hypothetical protein
MEYALKVIFAVAPILSLLIAQVEAHFPRGAPMVDLLSELATPSIFLCKRVSLPADGKMLG